MSNDKYRALTTMAADQHGVFSVWNARDLGIARSTIASGVELGRFRRVAPSVYAIVGSPETTLQRLSTAVLSVPALAALSHDTAAEMWGLTQRGVRRAHVVARRWDRVRRQSIVVHESVDLIPEDVVVHKGIPTTTPQRTVVDLGASNRWIVESALEEGIRRGLMTMTDVETVIDRVGRKGRRGVGVIRPLIEARRAWSRATESVLEDRFRNALNEVGLPEPVPQYVVRDHTDAFVCRADFAYPKQRVLIELDSETHHMDAISFRRDRSKHNRATLLGWTVLRFTWWDLNTPYRVGADVQAALDGHTS